MNKNWWFISYMFGMNIGASLYLQRNDSNHIFIENNTNEPFITTDYPITNIHDSLGGLDKYEPPESTDFIYPLSPKYAYMINDSNKYSHASADITEEEVRKLNVQIALKANNHIFATSKEQIQEIKSEMKKLRKLTSKSVNA
jgi:hypothetical protein